jgi:hypothetical protein
MGYSEVILDIDIFDTMLNKKEQKIYQASFQKLDINLSNPIIEEEIQKLRLCKLLIQDILKLYSQKMPNYLITLKNIIICLINQSKLLLREHMYESFKSVIDFSNDMR